MAWKLNSISSWDGYMLFFLLHSFHLFLKFLCAFMWLKYVPVTLVFNFILLIYYLRLLLCRSHPLLHLLQPVHLRASQSLSTMILISVPRIIAPSLRLQQPWLSLAGSLRYHHLSWTFGHLHPDKKGIHKPLTITIQTWSHVGIFPLSSCASEYSVLRTCLYQWCQKHMCVYYIKQLDFLHSKL